MIFIFLLATLFSCLFKDISLSEIAIVLPSVICMPSSIKGLKFNGNNFPLADKINTVLNHIFNKLNTPLLNTATLGVINPSKVIPDNYLMANTSKGSSITGDGGSSASTQPRG